MHKKTRTPRLRQDKTSILIETFRDARPIVTMSDQRLQQNSQVLEWFQNWEAEHQLPKDKRRKLLSPEIREDITCMILGFHNICQRRIRENKSTIPA